MSKVSVVIPVYNVEDYLEKCLDSLIHQTLEEIEIDVYKRQLHAAVFQL